MSANPGPPRLRTREKLPGPPQQTRSLERRKKLLDAARTLFVEKGFEATSIHDITSRAGAAAGGFYLYFPSKRQLLVALMNELLEHLGGLALTPTGGKDVRAGLRSFLAAVFRADLDYYGVVRAWQEASLTDDELGRMQSAIQSWTAARIKRVFHSLQRHPAARSGRDISTFAQMMDRHFWSLLARGSKMRPAAFDREVKTAADVIYHYLFRDSD